MSKRSRKKAYPRFKDLLDYLVYLLVRLVEEAICLVPGDERALKIGRFVGRLMFALAGDRRDVTIENLTVAFGDERDTKEIRLLARKNFEHLGMLGVEFVRIRRWSHEKMARKLIIEGRDNFNFVWSPGARGTFYMTAHFGSFEVLAATNRFLGIKGTVIVTTMRNRFVNRRLLFSRGGAESGLRILPHKGIVRKSIRLLQGGEMVYALVDQRGDDNRPIWVDYFGQKVLANGIWGRLPMEGNSFVYPVTAIRLENGTYKCIFGDEVPLQATGNLHEDLTVNCQRYHRIVEDWLRQYPEQGFWMHRKFKRKPKRRRRRRQTGPLKRLQYLLGRKGRTSSGV